MCLFLCVCVSPLLALSPSLARSLALSLSRARALSLSPGSTTLCRLFYGDSYTTIARSRSAEGALTKKKETEKKRGGSTKR